MVMDTAFEIGMATSSFSKTIVDMSPITRTRIIGFLLFATLRLPLGEFPLVCPLNVLSHLY